MFFACGIYVWCVVVRVTCFLRRILIFLEKEPSLYFMLHIMCLGRGGGKEGGGFNAKNQHSASISRPLGSPARAFTATNKTFLKMFQLF